MNRSSTRIMVVAAALSLVLAACGDDDDDAATDATEATAASTAPGGADTAETAPPDETTADDGTIASDGTTADDGTTPAGDAWTVSTDDCVDPDSANEPIEDTIRIGSSMPLSGGPAASAYAPFADGLNAYVAYANENELVPGYEISLEIGDDQFDPALTPGVVNGLLDEGVHLFTGIIGSSPSFAVRDTLNEECVPQMFGQSGAPEWGNVAEYPWSTAGLIPYDIEGAAYAAKIVELLPDEPTVGMFYVNIEFGQLLNEGFLAGAEEEGIEVVETQTIEASEVAPPSAQVGALAVAQPDAIVAVPLGAQCPVFLTELANAKAANPGWEPVVFITNTCASKQILGAAGAAADGLYSSASAGLRDPDDPAQADVPEVAEYRAAMEEGGYPESSISVGAAGWNVMNVTVEILRRAVESEEGLTRASIINTARNLDFHASMTRDGVEYRMSGEEDPFYTEDVQILQYESDTGTFAEIGDLITSFRYS